MGRIVRTCTAIFFIACVVALSGCPSRTAAVSPSTTAERDTQPPDAIAADAASPAEDSGAKSAESQDNVDENARAALAKAIDYLMRQQGKDGSFKSTTYGVLKQGPATTSLAMYAMGHVQDEKLVAPHREALQRAYMFLRPGLEKKGQVAAPDGTLDYPTYDAAMVLVAARRLKLPIPDKDRRVLEQWLVDMQLKENHGVKPDSIQYGGWDLEAAQGASGDQLKGSNIALAALCLEALSESMHADASAAVTRARQWVHGAQNADGGFVFHPWRPHPGNKAMWEDDAQTKAFSYGTPTSDGLRCLIYAGFKDDEAPVKSAAQWIVDHPDVEYVPGFEAKASDVGWREGLRYYYYYTQAKALSLLPEKEADRRRAKLKKVLIAEQREDGRYQNEEPRMFEDDPLLATGLAMVALAEALR